MNKPFKINQIKDSNTLETLEYTCDIFEALFQSLEVNMTDSRYRALVQTKLEEACFFACRAVSGEAEQ